MDFFVRVVDGHFVHGVEMRQDHVAKLDAHLRSRPTGVDLALRRLCLRKGDGADGDPLDPETRLGALVSAAHFGKVCGYLEKAESVVLGGKAEAGFVEATVVEVSARWTAGSTSAVA